MAKSAGKSFVLLPTIAITRHKLEILVDHFVDELVETRARPPPELGTSLGGAAAKSIDLGRSEVTLVDFDNHAPAHLANPLLAGPPPSPSHPTSAPSHTPLPHPPHA